jgi:ribokinase
VDGVISVFGSVNMDLVAYVEAAPGLGETVTGRAFRMIPGGKGANQAIAAARAGAEVAFVGAVGDDPYAAELRRTLAASGVGTDRLRTVPGSSGIAHIVVDDEGGNSIIVIPGANGGLTGPAAEDTAVIAASSALLLQLELPMAAVVAAAQAARSTGVEVVLTPAPARELAGELLDAVDVLVPNEHEAVALTGAASPEEAVRRLLERVPEVVVTLGARGALHASRDGERLRVPPFPVTAVDTTGAGDTFVGALAVARAEGRPPADALRFASAAAALSVQREGASTSMPARAGIDELLRTA